MTSDEGFRRQLEDYLEAFEGQTPLPDHVRDAVAAELPGVRQVRPRPGPSNWNPMPSSSLVRWGVLAACLVLGVGFGSIIVAGPGGPGPAVTTPSPSPTPSPTSSAATSPSASADAGPVLLALGPVASCPSGRGMWCLEPGTYRLGPAAPGGLVDVPAGWLPFEPGSGAIGLLVDRPDLASGSGWGVVVMTVGDVSRDPCDRAAGTFAPDEVDTPEELAAAMTSWPGFQATPAEPTTIGNVDGVSTRVTSTRGPEACVAPVIWETGVGIPIDGYPMVDGARSEPGMGYPAEFRLVPFQDGVLALRIMDSGATSPFEVEQGIAEDPDRHAADLPGLRSIVDSIRFEDPVG